MTHQKYQHLTVVLSGAKLQILQTKSGTYLEQAEQNFFLSMSNLEALFEPGHTPDSRFNFVLEKLAARFYFDAAVESLSTALVLEQAVIHDLLSNQLDQAQTLKVLRSAAFINSDSRVA